MSSINISIKKEAYEFLKSMKNKDKGIMEFFGVLKHIDWNEQEKNMKNLRDSFNRKLSKK